MNTSMWAKIFGWSQFGLQLFGQFGQNAATSGMPHGVWSWFGVVASALTAVAVHHASNTGGPAATA